LTVVFGKRKCAKLSFYLFALNQYLGGASLTIISPHDQERMLERLKIAKSNISNFSNLDKQLSLNFLKSDRAELKASYGLELLNDDLEKAIEKSDSRFILFHSFNHFFDVPDGRFIEPTIQTIAKLAKRHGKQVLFTCDTESENHKLVSHCFSTQADLIFNIDNSNQSTVKELNIAYSIYPVEIFNYQFLLKNGALSLDIKIEKQELKSPELSITAKVGKSESAVKKVLLLSDNQDMIRLHEYLLRDNDEIDFKVCKNITDALAALLSKPSLIINHCEDIEEHHSLALSLEENQIAANLIFLINKKYVREEDRIKASEQYNCNQIFDLSFRAIDYILAIETSIDKRFYPRIKYQQKQANRLLTHDAFNQQLAEHRKRKLLYCVHHFKHLAVEPSQLASLLRGCDAFYMDESKNCSIICVNSQAEDALAIQNKVAPLSTTATLLESSNLLENLTIEAEVVLA